VLGWADPPLRLALGDDATAAIRSKLAAVADDLERTADISHQRAIST
jgi:hypothetical protein